MTHATDPLTTALRTISDPTMTSDRDDIGRGLFVGSGDSLAACLLLERFGHRAQSAGDLAWVAGLPPGYNTVVGVSHSGRTAATIQAIDAARTAGRNTVAVTANSSSPLALAAHSTVLAPAIEVDETIPAAGYVALALAALALEGIDTSGAAAAVADGLALLSDCPTPVDERWPIHPPDAISVLTLPDLRSAGDFWSLKLIEATGLCVRSVPLEEAGHVDYFIGPQSHLSIHLIGSQGTDRHRQLAQALTGNGHHVVSIAVPDPATGGDPMWSEIALAAYGAYVAHETALRWNRPPFRGGHVPMDARHIQTSTDGP
jgi:hypothetical protein